MEGIKPCPFCGSADVEVIHVGDGDCYVACGACGSSGPDGFGDAAIEKWNRRTNS